MKSILLSALLFSAAAFAADNDAQLKAVQAADDARVTAMVKPDAAELAKLLSDDLHYAHSSGSIDTKATLTEALTSGRSDYLGIDYQERNFTFPTPDVAMMTGKARVQVSSAKGKMDAVLAFLAIWRQEQGQWRFLAWQSCKLPAATN